MENAAQALRLAAWVLIFVAALSITMNAFSLAKGSIDTILTLSDREYLTSYIPPSGKTRKIVSYESIIPAIYRSFKENYKVVFPETDDYKLYKKSDEEWIYVIDLTINGMQDSLKEEFIKRILNGQNYANLNPNNNFKNITFGDGLYKAIQGKQFYEKIGLYYEGEENGATNVPEASKKIKRVITYEEV